LLCYGVQSILDETPFKCMLRRLEDNVPSSYVYLTPKHLRAPYSHYRHQSVCTQHPCCKAQSRKTQSPDMGTDPAQHTRMSRVCPRIFISVSFSLLQKQPNSPPISPKPEERTYRIPESSPPATGTQKSCGTACTTWWSASPCM
jgi:hypothetical protein